MTKYWWSGHKEFAEQIEEHVPNDWGIEFERLDFEPYSPEGVDMYICCCAYTLTKYPLLDNHLYSISERYGEGEGVKTKKELEDYSKEFRNMIPKKIVETDHAKIQKEQQQNILRLESATSPKDIR